MIQYRRAHLSCEPNDLSWHDDKITQWLIPQDAHSWLRRLTALLSPQAPNGFIDL